MTMEVGFSMGPKLKGFLARDFLEPDQLIPVLFERMSQNSIDDEETLIDLVDELISMDCPEAVLKVLDAYPSLWRRADYRGLRAEGLSAMLLGEHARAELAFHEANQINPQEMAPYVNLAQIALSEARIHDAINWCQLGLTVDHNYYRLWELFAVCLQNQKDSNPEHVACVIKDKSKELSSWAGASLAADLDPLANQHTKAMSLESFFQEGELSQEFLTEYTGALGGSGLYEKIPPILWQVRKFHPDSVSWQLQLHCAQAHLAMEQNAQFLREIEGLKTHPDLPKEALALIESLIAEIGENSNASSSH